MRIAGILMLARAFDLHAGVHVVQEIAAQETEEERKAYVDEFLRKSIETQKALGISVGKHPILELYFHTAISSSLVTWAHHPPFAARHDLRSILPFVSKNMNRILP